jgi:hypothetical protein
MLPSNTLALPTATDSGLFALAGLLSPMHQEVESIHAAA